MESLVIINVILMMGETRDRLHGNFTVFANLKPFKNFANTYKTMF